MTLRDTAFMVVRKTNGKYWLNISTASFFADGAKGKADRVDALCPNWSKDNPQVRIAKVEVREVIDT